MASPATVQIWFVKEFADKRDPGSNKHLLVPVDAKCEEIVALCAAAANNPGFAEFAKTHPNDYRLVHNGQTIEGDTTLCDVGAGHCARISCLLKLKGGARGGGGEQNEDMCKRTCEANDDTDGTASAKRRTRTSTAPASTSAACKPERVCRLTSKSHTPTHATAHEWVLSWLAPPGARGLCAVLGGS